MKDLTSFIKESIDDINKYYVNIADLKNGQKYWVGVCTEENGDSKPMELVFKKNGKEFIFVNPDDDREMYDWHDLINSTGDDEKTPQVTIFKDKKIAQKFCNYYNDINAM